MELITGTIAGATGVYILKKTFDRAPKRNIPESGIVSPASGKIIAIENIDPTDFFFYKKGVRNDLRIPELGRKALMIVIEMNIKDVHVQRSPIDGKVVFSKHIKGRHKNVIHGKKKKDAVYENEKQITVIEGDVTNACVIQVAGFVARRIKTRVSVGKKVKKGQIIGKISFGSQTILILPNKKRVSVNIGDRVIDGETIVSL